MNVFQWSNRQRMNSGAWASPIRPRRNHHLPNAETLEARALLATYPPGASGLAILEALRKSFRPTFADVTRTASARSVSKTEVADRPVTLVPGAAHTMAGRTVPQSLRVKPRLSVVPDNVVRLSQRL